MMMMMMMIYHLIDTPRETIAHLNNENRSFTYQYDSMCTDFVDWCYYNNNKNLDVDKKLADYT